MRNVEIIQIKHPRCRSGKAFRIMGGAIWEDVLKVGIDQGLTTPGSKVDCTGVIG